MVKKALKNLTGALSEEEYLWDGGLSNLSEWAEETTQEGQLAVDVYQTEHDIVVKAPIAGVEEDNIEIIAQSDLVSIRGERSEEKEVSKENYHSQECFWGAFSRTVPLPVEGDPQKAKVTFKNGILTIRIPKRNQEKTVRLKVNQ